MPPVKIKTKPALFILERNDFREYPLGHNIRSYDTPPLDIDKAMQSDETVVRVTNYDTDEETGSIESDTEIIAEEQAIPVNIPTEIDSNVDTIVPILEDNLDNNIETSNNEIVEEIKAPIIEEVVQIEEDKSPKLQKAKKALDDLKTLRQERKKKAIEKIKSETRKEVVASAKEKLKEIMKRHNHIAKELSESIISDITVELEAKDGRGDIPEEEMFPEVPQADIVDETESKQRGDAEKSEEKINKADGSNNTNENIDNIVEEVIVRLIDRKIYDDKTKPEDMKPEDRLMIQKIVEEVLAEKLNYSNSNNSK